MKKIFCFLFFILPTGLFAMEDPNNKMIKAICKNDINTITILIDNLIVDVNHVSAGRTFLITAVQTGICRF